LATCQNEKIVKAGGGYVDNSLRELPHIPTAQQQLYLNKFEGRPKAVMILAGVSC
jgi:hypothetical protein